MRSPTPNKKGMREKSRGLLDHVFYWVWRHTSETGGLPIRSHIIVSFVKTTYLLLPVCILLLSTDDVTAKAIYECTGEFTAGIFVLPMVLIALWDGHFYNEKRYNRLCGYYDSASGMEVFSRRRQSIVCIVLSVIAFALEIWILFHFDNRCEMLMTDGMMYKLKHISG